MPLSSRTVLVLVALTAGCGASANAPPPATAAAKPAEPEALPPAPDLSPNKLNDRRAEAGVRAPAKPLVVGGNASVKCGKIGKPEKEASELLSGRLKLQAPAGAKAPPVQPEQPPIEEESRLVVDAPEKAKEREKIALAIVAKETFQLDPDMYEPEEGAPAKPGTLDVEAPKFLKATMPSEQPLEVSPVEIGTDTKLRGYVARPKDPNAAPGKDTALVLGLLLAQEDGTLQSVGFYVRGESVRNATGSELVGCTRLAERIASTIVPGPRKLERAAGRRHVADVPPDRELVVSVPADYVVVPTAAGAKVTKLRPLSLYAGSIAVSLADQKKADAGEGADTAQGKMFGRPTEWRGQSTPKGGFFFTAEPVDESKSKIAEVLVKATRQAKALDEMRGVAETLAVVKRAP
ncbi:MAG: hypothetical protein KIT84_13110 [Labilithrix sp.]|nr:hypothetical protein [Labilithrix sp.]MCW5811955.1 hypothetical protein [Labilithrix sp.]